MEPRNIAVAAGGAAMALVVGLGAGALGRAPIDRAMHPHPMDPVPGTSQIAIATPPLTAAAPVQAAPITVAERGYTPTIATGDDPPTTLQRTSTDEAGVDGPVADSAAADVQAPPAQSSAPRYARSRFHSFREGQADEPPPWADRGPPPWANRGPPPWAYREAPRWAPPPPPPDDDPD